MILNEGSTCETIREEVESQEAKEHEEEQEKEKDNTWEFMPDQILVKNERLSLEGCVYRGEGNANVVLALPNERKVVRFRKSTPSGEPSPDGGRARTTQEVDFLKYVISGFLGDFVEPPESIRVTREEMIKMSQAIRALRPEYRRLKEIVEEYATIFVDYAFLRRRITTLLRHPSGPTFCVEIKPKQGFRHELDEKFKKCTYCLTQYYKLKSGAIKSRSSYCPFDLFSGDILRMKKSLRGLLDSPQNNLKIFREGIVVYDANSGPSDLENIFSEWFAADGLQTAEENLDAFFRLVCAALLREFSRGSEKPATENGPFAGLSSEDFDPRPRIDREIVARAKEILYFCDDECNFVGRDVPRDSVLGRILNMQQLPYHSAHVVYKIYSKHFAKLNDQAFYSRIIRMYRGENKVSVTNGKKRANREDSAPSKAADSSINLSTSKTRISDSNGNANNTTLENSDYPVASLASLDSRNNNEERNGSITAEELEALQNYLLVTTAKDCSILMAFKEIDSKEAPDIPEEFIVAATDRLNFVVNIGVLDLDPKAIHCVEKHKQRDTNVLVSLTNILEREHDFRNQSPLGSA